MTTTFIRKSRNEMIKYNRPRTEHYVTKDGHTAVSAPDRIRINHSKEGYLLGIKFGDGDTATIPTNPNRLWNATPVGGGTLVAIGQAPQGVTWLKCGTTEIAGIDAHKLHIVELTPEQVTALEDRIEIFPNSDDIPGDCHLLMVKYYQQTGIDFGTEKVAMTEFNDFLHGAWK